MCHSGKTTQIPQFCADYAFPLENAPTTENNGNAKNKNTNSDAKNSSDKTTVSDKNENFEKNSDQHLKDLKSNEKNGENRLGVEIDVKIDNNKISTGRTAPYVSTVQPTRIIAVTQPRRVAAVTVAQRVSAERSGMHGLRSSFISLIYSHILHS